MARKTEFELEGLGGDCSGTIEIVGQAPENKSYVLIDFESNLLNGGSVRRTAEIKHVDLERFAVNILKALGSKKLALSQRYNSKDFFSKKKKLKK